MNDKTAKVDTQDYMSLAEHDHIYHHDHYKEGDDCLVRERMALGDYSDEALAQATQLEAAQYATKESEKEMITTAFEKNIPILGNRAKRKLNGVSMSVSDQDKQGEVTVTIATFPVVPDDAISEKDVKQIVQGKGGGNNKFLTNRDYFGIGYKLKSFKVGTLRGNNTKNGGKKLFVIKMHKDQRIGELSPASRALLQKKPEVQPEPELSEAQKNEMLKRYGIKISGGQASRIGRDDAKESDAQRYLRFVSEGGTALKNKSNAQIAAERKEQREAMAKNAAEFRREILSRP